ncbi:MAG: hypothetical protein ACP5PZ_10100 [Bacteroidales bacterium]
MRRCKFLVSLVLLAFIEMSYGQYAGYFSKSGRMLLEQSHLGNVNFHSAFATVANDSDTITRHIRLIPLINANFGISTHQNAIYNFFPGLFAFYPIGHKITLWLVAAVNIEKYPYLISSQIDSNRVLPEGGSARVLYNSTYFRLLFVGELSYRPIKYCSLDAGYGKKQWGDGYRSLWLSDYSTYYPYLQLRVHFWKIQYHILWSYLKDINTGATAGRFLDKYGVFHFFDFNATPRLSFGFFESVIWWGRDANTQRGFELSYLNPIVFFRPVEYSLHSPDNANLGFHASILLGKATRLYQQLFVDDMSVNKMIEKPQWWGNKYGILAGIKTFQLFGIANLFCQAEYARVRPFTYSHSSSALNYGAEYQPLGHPLGANFEEILFVLRLRRGPWSFMVKTSLAAQGRDSLPTQNVGQNIYRSYLTRQTIHDEARFLQGELHRLYFGELRMYRSLSKRIPLYGFVGIQYFHDRAPYASIAETIIRVGVTANFFNDERDYR